MKGVEDRKNYQEVLDDDVSRDVSILTHLGNLHNLVIELHKTV